MLEKKQLAVFTIVMVISFLGIGVMSGAASADSSIELKPSEDNITVGDKKVVDVVMTNADRGVSAYDVNISLSSEKATITNYTINSSDGSSGPLDNSEISSDGQSVKLSSALLDSRIEPGSEVLIGQIVLQVEDPGNLSVNVDSAQVVGFESQYYNFKSLGSAEYSVVEDKPKGTLDSKTTDSEVGVGDNTTFDIVMLNSEAGVGAYKMTYNLEGPGEIVGYELVSGDGTREPLDNSEISTDGKSIYLSAALLDNTLPKGDRVKMAKVYVKAEGTAGDTVRLKPQSDSEVTSSGDYNDLGYGQKYDLSYNDGDSFEVVNPRPSGTLDIRVAEDKVNVGETVKADIVLENAENGVGAYTFNISAKGASDAKIVGYNLGGSSANSSITPSADILDGTEILDNGKKIRFNVALLDNTFAPDKEVVIGQIELKTDSQGPTNLTFDDSDTAISGVDDLSYRLSTEVDGFVVVGPPPVSGEDPPTDIDGDGEYEDVNGDGEFNIFDVQVLFTSLNDNAVEQNPRYFDFSESDSAEEMTIIDVQSLFMDYITHKFG